MIQLKFRILLLILLLIGICDLSIYSQLRKRAIPKGTTLDELDCIEKKEHQYTLTTTALKDVEQQIKNAQPLKFAHQFTVNYTPENSGNWEVLEDGTKVWRLVISSPGAYTINLIFDRYKLPEGAMLFIYNADMSDVIGAFTSANNKEYGILATAPVSGDEIIIEYQEPKSAEFAGELLIGAINHDYLGVHSYTQLKSGNFGDSGYCNVDISCYDPDEDIDVRRAVVKMLINGSYLCTGTLINNTAEDGTPYVITAAHCLVSDETANSTVIYFNYESPHCSGVIDGNKSNTLSGATTCVYAEDLDIALIEMTNDPETEYRPYYAGWTLDSSPSSPFTCIHHPQGDVKKNSTASDDLIAYSFVESANSPYAQYADFHWKVAEWVTGTTEGGSSGSSLLDANYNVVGTLSGGEAYCGYSYNDYFTQFYKGWDLRSDDDAEHFEVWLDPDSESSGVQSLSGFDPYEENLVSRLSNIESGESLALDRYNGSGYISGHNSSGITTYAESFSGVMSATLKGVYLMVGESTSGSSQTIDVLVWEGTSEPEDLVVRKEGITLNALGEDEETYVEFDSDVNVEGQFFVGYEIDYSGSPIDSFAIYHSAEGSEKSVNTMMVKESGNWDMATEVFGGDNKSLWIDVLAEMVVLGDTQIVTEEDDEISIYPNPVGSDNVVYIDVSGSYVDSYSVVDLNGRILIAKDVLSASDDVLSVNLEGIPTGVYIVKIKLESKDVVKKLVVYSN